MDETTKCPRCGARLPVDPPSGLCPRCLVAAGVVSGEPTKSCGDGAAAKQPSSFNSPSVEELSPLFPQLEIIEFLGAGGMGAVYKARQPGLDRLVAVKILPREVGDDPSFAERFSREARALARLSHPNIVAIHDFGSSEGLYFLVMEFIDGVNLRHTIRSGELRSKESLAVVSQICDALQYAHDEGVVHRDIKPENILLDKKSRAKIADFGLSKLLGETGNEATLTGTHQVMGTLHYMAPEQMKGTHNVDHRADIYSLGVVFYEMLTGELPMGRFEPPSRRVQLDIRLDEVVLRSLEREPDKRYQQANDVKTDVGEIVDHPASCDRSAADDSGRLAPWLPWNAFGVYAVCGVFLPLFLVHQILQRQISPTNVLGLAIGVSVLTLVAWIWERWPYDPALSWRSKRNWTPVLAPFAMFFFIGVFLDRESVAAWYRISASSPAEADGLTQRIANVVLLFSAAIFMIVHRHPLHDAIRRWRSGPTSKRSG